MTIAFTNSGMPEHFGIRITSAEKDKLVGELDADHRHVNRGGHVHGGTLAAFGDDLGGTLAGLNVAPRPLAGGVAAGMTSVQDGITTTARRPS